MIEFSAEIEKFGQQGEKSGWHYVAIPREFAEQLHPGSRVSFRVRGSIDAVSIDQHSLMPMGDGDYILPLKQALLRRLHKVKGSSVRLMLSYDDRPLEIDADLLACLDDEPQAKDFFESLTPSHQRYFSKWIGEAKTEATRTKRLAQALRGLSARLDFGAMTKLK